MLNTASPLSQSPLDSALAGTSRIRPRPGARARRGTLASLMLTSLVDAFSILVIFLMMNHSASQEVVETGKLTLPQATESQLIQSGVVVRIEGEGRFLVENEPVALSDLAGKLKALNQSVETAKKEGIVVVADRNMDYEALSPVIMAGSQAGFTKFKFAVIRKD